MLNYVDNPLKECSRKMKGGIGLRRKIFDGDCCVYKEKLVKNDSYRRT